MKRIATFLAPILAFSAAATATTVSVRVASAEPYDRKDLPGLSCQVGYNEGSVSYYQDGKFYNDSSTWWRTALCPLVVDREWRGHSDSIALRFRVTDRSYDQDISCRMMDGFDNWTNWGAASTTSGSNNTSQELIVADGGGGIALWALCYVPKTYNGQRSSIDSYSWNEHETTSYLW